VDRRTRTPTDPPPRGRRRAIRRAAAGALGLEAIERERGISVSSTVMSFEHQGLAFNPPGMPGHQNFSEDTYRTLTAVDSAVMVLDAAPDGANGASRSRHASSSRSSGGAPRRSSPSSAGSTARAAKLPRLLPKEALAKLREEVEMAKALCPAVRRAGLSRGASDPGLFRQRAQQFRCARIVGPGRRIGPGARPQPAEPRPISPEGPGVAGFQRLLLTNPPQDLT
jgi:hypothetical protein